MLVSLHVKNFAIIDEIWLDFGAGFNVLSGETGAGKSLLIGSLNAALGGKVSKDVLGSSADYALAELTFESDAPEIAEIFEKNDLIPDSGQVVISRRIASNGRSVCRINGETVTASVLKEIAEVLIDIHGQHEHQSLLYPAGQRRIVDSFLDVGKEAAAKVKSSWMEYKKALDKLSEAEKNGRKSRRELELLEYELDEITAAALKDGEDEVLEERFRVLANTEKILEGLKEAEASLKTGNTSAEDSVDVALRCMGRLSSFGSELNDMFEKLSLISESLSEFNVLIDDYMEGISGSEEEFAQVSERLDTINKLKSKYGQNIKEIREYAENCRKQLDEYSDFDAYVGRLQKELELKEKTLADCCGELSEARKKSTGILQEKINLALSELNFENARFEIQLIPLEKYSEYGAEDISFMLSANLGEPLRKLSAVASGGELSRIMLAIKSVVAGENAIDSLVFDEIDTGISGRTAQKVAEKIALIASEHQVICITHLPQIAAMADNHYLIEKKQENGRTKTGVTRLSEEDEITELARMLGGVRVTDSVLESAREMKELASEAKSGFRKEKKE